MCTKTKFNNGYNAIGIISNRLFYLLKLIFNKIFDSDYTKASTECDLYNNKLTGFISKLHIAGQWN